MGVLYYVLAGMAATAIAIQAPINSRLGQLLLMGQPLLAALVSTVGDRRPINPLPIQSGFQPVRQYHLTANPYGNSARWLTFKAFMVFSSAYLPSKSDSVIFFIIVAVQLTVGLIIDQFGLLRHAQLPRRQLASIRRNCDDGWFRDFLLR